MRYVLTLLILFATSPLRAQSYDLIIRNGMVYDGRGGKPYRADIGIRADRIAAIGNLSRATAGRMIDARGQAVAPGFVNMLSHAYGSLLIDGRGLSDLRQGVTLEVFGEVSMGPLNATMRQQMLDTQGPYKFDIPWTTLGEFMTHLEKKGVTMNFASFVSHQAVRMHELGLLARQPTPAEFGRMRAHVRQAMTEGALGLTAALIYVPDVFSKTEELIALAQDVKAGNGMMTAHIRSEGDRFDGAVNELLRIGREGGIPVEIYHLKAAGKRNWPKIDRIIGKIDSARRAGLRVTTNMYNYTAGATGLDAAMPPDVQEGGINEWRKRLQDPAIRARVAAEMQNPATSWENLCLAAGPDKTLFLYFQTDSLQKYVGKTLAEVAALRGTSWPETAMDLVVQDGTRVDVAYFLMSEENVRKQIKLPYMSFGSDADAQAPEGPFLIGKPHPRTYGNVARLLGRYVRDEKLIPLPEAIRRLTLLPCQNLKIKERGQLKPGYFADVVIFDPATIADHATFEQPQQFATGVEHVVVNGKLVLQNGQPTAERPGRAVRGPGYVAGR